MDDTDLMAYADGRLAGREKARVEAAIKLNSELQRKVARYQATAPAGLQPLFRDILETPVPSRLSAVVERGAMTSRPAAVPARASWQDWLSLAHWNWSSFATIAAPAGVAFAFVLAVGTTRPQPDPFRAVMETAQSGTEVSFRSHDGLRSLTPVLSFRDTDGRFCRRYDLQRAAGSATAGIACRDGTGTWRIVLEEDGAPVARADETTTAGAGDSTALDAKLSAMKSGDALGRQEEDDALRKGWK